MQRRSLRAAGFALLALSGCFASEGQLRQRAASDFQCDTNKLTVTDAGKGVYTVSGCDQKENYVYNSDAKAWLRESESGGRVVTLPR